MCFEILVCSSLYQKSPLYGDLVRPDVADQLLMYMSAVLIHNVWHVPEILHSLQQYMNIVPCLEYKRPDLLGFKSRI